MLELVCALLNRDFPSRCRNNVVYAMSEHETKPKFAPAWPEVNAMLGYARYIRAQTLWLGVLIFVTGGLRLAEECGQRVQIAFCRCRRCRSLRLHNQGKTLEEIADALKIGNKRTEFLLDEALKYGEHARKPMPGLRVMDVDFNSNRLTIYGKGWSSGRHRPEIHPIKSTTITAIKKYVNGRGLNESDRVIPLSDRHMERQVKRLAVNTDAWLRHLPDTLHSLETEQKTASEKQLTEIQRKIKIIQFASEPFGDKQPYIENAPLISPHRLRDFYITLAVEKYPLHIAQRLARHKDPKVTATYIDLRKEQLAAIAEDIFNFQAPTHQESIQIAE